MDSVSAFKSMSSSRLGQIRLPAKASAQGLWNPPPPLPAIYQASSSGRPVQTADLPLHQHQNSCTAVFLCRQGFDFRMLQTTRMLTHVQSLIAQAAAGGYIFCRYLEVMEAMAET